MRIDIVHHSVRHVKSLRTLEEDGYFDVNQYLVLHPYQLPTF